MLIEQLPFIVIVSTGMLVILIFCVWYVFKTKDRIKYGNVDRELLFAKRIDAVSLFFARSKVLSKLFADLALKLSIFNAKSYTVNMRYAVVAFILLSVLFAGLSVALFVVFIPLWYMAVAYILLVSALILLILVFAARVANSRILAHMPDTLRILSSRYTSINNIAKCIGISINDFHKSIRGDMIRIYDALKLNDMERIRNTFDAIDTKYSNEHMTLLLELIWHAYYNGGDEVIKGRFNDMLEDIIEDIENRKDLAAASLSYIGMGVLFGFAVPVAKYVNEKMLGIQYISYYSGREGILLQLLYYLFLTGFIFLIIIIERS